MTFMGPGCLWMPTHHCPHHISSALTILVHSPCGSASQSTPRQARSSREQPSVMKDEYQRINIPDSSLIIWNDLEAYSTACPKVPSRSDLQLPAVVNCLIIHYWFWALPCPLLIPSSTSWDHLPSKLLALKSLSQDLLLGESKLSQPSYSSWSSEGEPFEMYKLLIFFLICCHIFCLILCHFLSMLPICNLSKQTWNYKWTFLTQKTQRDNRHLDKKSLIYSRKQV